MQFSDLPSRPASAAKACEKTRTLSMVTTLTMWRKMKGLETDKKEGQENVKILPSGELSQPSQNHSTTRIQASLCAGLPGTADHGG